MDRRRLADVRAGTAAKVHCSGSGYLVGVRLVLTARHVVVDDSGVIRPRIIVSVGHPVDGQLKSTAHVCWQDPLSDFVLLRVDAQVGMVRRAIRWGCFIASDPYVYEGLGFPRFSDYESGHGVEQLRGQLPPLAVGEDYCYVLDQSAAPEVTPGRVWGGASGAAIFCNNLLVAIVTKDDRSFANRRLHAARIVSAFSNSEFVRLIEEDTGSRPIIEAVELSEYLRPPVRPTVANTPGMILAPDLEAVSFAGREQVLDSLSQWRDSSRELAVALVIGEGGSGKTRLAREFAVRSVEKGWIAGFGRAAARYGNGQRIDIEEVCKSLRVSARPVIIVVDYAETHPDDIVALAEGLCSNPPVSPVRLLLLARGVGGWWENLSDIMPPEGTGLIALQPFTEGILEREKAYTAAVHDLARYLEFLGEESLEGDPREDWRIRAAQLADKPPDLSSQKFGNALTLHIAALNDLLSMETGLGRARSFQSQEVELVRHEAGYLKRAAHRRGLFERNILSNATDPDDRMRDVWSALERAVAGMILLGPADPERAIAIAGLGSSERANDINGWLSAMYPPPVGSDGIGTMQPDRLAEFFLGDILSRESTLLDRVAGNAVTLDKAIVFVFILLRVSSHPQFSFVGRQARSLVQARPDPFGEAALILTVNLAHAASAQGISSAVSVLEAVLEQAQSLSPLGRPDALAAVMKMAAGRLAELRGEIESGFAQNEIASTGLTPGIADGPSKELYTELALSSSAFLPTLLDAALDVIGISVGKAAEKSVRNVPAPELAASSFILEPTQRPRTADENQLMSILYHAHYRSLVRLAALLVHDVPTAEEVVQDSFISAYDGFRRLRDPEKSLSYLRQAVVNRSRSVLRRRAIEEKNAPKPLPDEPSAEVSALESFERSQVVEVIRGLPARQREALVLHYYADLSDAETAKAMKISRDSVQSHLRRGIKALREAIRKTEDR